MALALFWVKIILKKIFSLLKSSPVFAVWSIIIIGSFIYAFSNRHIELVLSIGALIIAVSFLIACPLLNSLKNYNVMPVLIKYSKSKYHNKNIIVRFCIKQALKNNIMLFCFNLFAFNFVTNVIYFIVIIGLTLLSIFYQFY